MRLSGFRVAFRFVEDHNEQLVSAAIATLRNNRAPIRKTEQSENLMVRLREEHRAAGKESQFDSLKTFITGGKSAGAYDEAAGKLGMREGAAKAAAHRLRKRYRELLRNEIARNRWQRR